MLLYCNGLQLGMAMSSKILLTTCSLAEKWIDDENPDTGHYPLGLGYLHAALEEAGHSAQTLFLNNVPYETCLLRIVEAINTFQPHVLGISIISDSRVSSFHVIEYVHTHFPNIWIILGGVHVSTMYEQLAVRFPYCTLVLGEGEITLRELVESRETGKDIGEIPGIAFFRDGQVQRTPARELVDDLDTLPYPHHHSFFSDKRVAAQLLTSRGCPFACSFCVLDSFSQRKVRYRSVENVVDEMEHILQTFPQVNMIQILDDQFFTDNKRVIAMCDEIVRRKLSCNFECAGRVKPLSKEMVVALERAGVTYVHLGLESGSPSVLKKCKKGITPEDAVRAMELFADSSIIVNILLIVGLPGECTATILETARLIQKLQAIKYHVCSHRIQTLFVYPGTEIYEMSKQAGTLDDDFWLSEESVPYYTAEHTSSELTVLREMLLTHVSPARLVTQGGLKAQRHLLSHIIRASFYQDDLRPIVNLTLHAAQSLMQEGHLSITMPTEWAGKLQSEGHLVFSTLTREPGSKGRFLLNFTQATAKDVLRDTVEFAYYNRISEFTDPITERVAAIFAQHASPGTPSDPALEDLDVLTWANHPVNQALLRL